MSGQFTDIRSKMENLMEDIGGVNEKMKELWESNNVIVDSVNTLSASSEEISTSTQEVCGTSAHNVELVQEFMGMMENIATQMDELLAQNE